MASTKNKAQISDPSEQLVALVNQAREGNRAAFARLADLFQQDMYRMVFYRIRSRTEAEDITQDVFLKAYQKISSLKDAAKFRGWLVSITLNRIRDFQRKKRFRSLFKAEDENIDAHPADNPGSDQPEALDLVLRKDFWRQVGLILKKLSNMEREVFLMRFFDHLSIREIAGVLQKNESTVKTHLYRALSKFKKQPAMRQFLSEVTSEPQK